MQAILQLYDSGFSNAFQTEEFPFSIDSNILNSFNEAFVDVASNQGDDYYKSQVKQIKGFEDLTDDQIVEISRDIYLINELEKDKEISNEFLEAYVNKFLSDNKGNDLHKQGMRGELTSDMVNALIPDNIFIQGRGSSVSAKVSDLQSKLAPYGFGVFSGNDKDFIDNFVNRIGMMSGTNFDNLALLGAIYDEFKDSDDLVVISPNGEVFTYDIMGYGVTGQMYTSPETIAEYESQGRKLKEFVENQGKGRKFHLRDISDLRNKSAYAISLATNDFALDANNPDTGVEVARLANTYDNIQLKLVNTENNFTKEIANEAMNMDYSQILDMYGINETLFKSTKEDINNSIQNILNSDSDNKIQEIQSVINNAFEGFMNDNIKSKEYSQDQIDNIKASSSAVFSGAFKNLDNSIKNSQNVLGKLQEDLRYVNALNTQASNDYQLAVTQKHIKDSKMGTKLGATWNSFINGAEATFAGLVSTGIDVATLASTPFVAIEAAGKKKSIYNEETGEWTTQDVTFAEEWDGLSKSSKAQTLPFIRSFSDTFGAGTTEEFASKWSEESFWGLAIQGLAGSALPMGLSMATGGTMGVPMFFGQAVEYQDQEIIKAQERGLLPEDMSEIEKWATKGPMAIAMSLLENYGARSFLKTGNINKTTPYVADLVSKTLKKLPKNSSYSTFLRALDKTFSNSFARGTLRVAEGFLSEFETGFAQHMSDEVIKETYDIFKSGDQSDIFTTSLQKGVLPFMKQAFISGLAEGVGGAKIGLIGGIQTGIQYNKYGDSLNDSQYELMELFVSGYENRATYVNSLNRKLKTDKNYTKKQYKEDLRKYDIAKNTIDQIPSEITDYADRRKMFDLINEKRAVNQQIKDKDSLFNSGKKNRIKEIDAEMESIREFGKTTESKVFDLSQNLNTLSYIMNKKSNKGKRDQLWKLLNKIKQHENGQIKLSQVELNDLITEAESIQKGFKGAKNKVTRKAAGEIQTAIDNLKTGITSNTISMNQNIEDGASQENLANENIGMYGNNNRETYIVNDEVLSRREFEEKLKDPEFVDKLMTGKNSFSVVNASSQTIGNLQKQFPQSSSREKSGFQIYKDNTIHLNQNSLSTARNISKAKAIAKKLGIGTEVLN